MGKHYVPQEYLRAFASTADHRAVWMYDKTTGQWSEPAVSKAAQQRDFYPQDIEDRITAEIESPGHTALKNLRRGVLPDATEREVLVHYVALLMMRGPRKRRRGWDLYPETLDHTMSKLRSEMERQRTIDNSPAVDSALRAIDRLHIEYRDDAPPEVSDAIHNPWPSDNIVNAVRSMVWRFTRIPKGHFLITSDTPVQFHESIGLGPESSELTWPISPTLALLGSRQGEPGSTHGVEVKSGIVKEINRRLAVGAERFVFSGRKVRWIEQISARHRTALNRIAWAE